MNNTKKGRTNAIYFACAFTTPFIIAFGLFAYGPFSKKPSPALECWASAKSKIPLLNIAQKQAGPDYVNVTSQFDILIKWEFWMLVLYLVYF